MFKAVAVELSADRGEVDNDEDAATSPIAMKGLSSYKNVMVMAREETERSERLTFHCLMSTSRAPPGYTANKNDNQRTPTSASTVTTGRPRAQGSDANIPWNPFVRVSEKDSEMLGDINGKLQEALAVTNGVLAVARTEFPKIEETFSSACDGILKMTEQVVEANRSFRSVKTQLQARTEAVNDSMDTLTKDIDNLRALQRNIRKDDFETGDYLEMFCYLTSHMHAHLTKTHNKDGEDLMDFREFTRRSVDIVTKLDPNTRRDRKDWSGIFKDMLTTLRSDSSRESAQRQGEREMLNRVKKAVDEVPCPTQPRAGPSNADANGKGYHSYGRRNPRGNYQGRMRGQRRE